MKKNRENRRRSLDSEEFVALMLAHGSRVRGFVMTLMLPVSDIDDVFQNACMAAFRKLETFSYEGETPDEEFVRWICTVAKFEVLQYYKKRRTARVAFSSDLVSQVADMQIEESETIQSRQEALKECIEKLSDKEQNLIAMRYGDAIPVADIAKRVGQSANGVYKALERIRARLMGCIRTKLKAEGLS